MGNRNVLNILLALQLMLTSFGTTTAGQRHPYYFRSRCSMSTVAGGMNLEIGHIYLSDFEPISITFKKDGSPISEEICTSYRSGYSCLSPVLNGEVKPTFDKPVVLHHCDAINITRQQVCFEIHGRNGTQRIDIHPDTTYRWSYSILYYKTPVIHNFSVVASRRPTLLFTGKGFSLRQASNGSTRFFPCNYARRGVGYASKGYAVHWGGYACLINWNKSNDTRLECEVADNVALSTTHEIVVRLGAVIFSTAKAKSLTEKLLPLIIVLPIALVLIVILVCVCCLCFCKMQQRNSRQRRLDDNPTIPSSELAQSNYYLDFPPPSDSLQGNNGHILMSGQTADHPV